MSNITPFGAFNEVSRFNSFNDDFFRGLSLSPLFLNLPSQPQMRMDVTEDDKAFTVKAELPGVVKEDIKVSVDGDQVSISAQVRKDKEEKKGNQVIRSERYLGSISRSISLGQKVNEDKAQAKYENGVLVLTLPKRPGAGARQLAVG